jgi:hypothetical protein
MFGDTEGFLESFSEGVAIEDWSEGNFVFRDGYLYYGDDEQVSTQATSRIVEMIKAGWDHGPMLRYLDNLYSNSSQRAVRESYNWSTHKGLPITEDGLMIGYKGVVKYTGSPTVDKHGRALVEGDLVDKFTGSSYRNNPGDDNAMNRRLVCDDHTQGCSGGLHVGTYEYACEWAGPGGQVVLVKFNPADIVSVPSDCSFSKIRVSSYHVLSVARGIIEDQVYEEEDEEEDEDEEDDEYDPNFLGTIMPVGSQSPWGDTSAAGDAWSFLSNEDYDDDDQDDEDIPF